MTESRLDTIPINAPEASGTSSNRADKKDAKARPISRPAVIGLVAILALAGGLGGWHYWASMKLVESGDSAAELEVLEAVTQLFEAETTEVTPAGAVGETRSAPMVSGSNRPASKKGSTSSSSDDSSERAEVWLTGTIEVDDDEPIVIPAKVSGGPDGSTQRR